MSKRPAFQFYPGDWLHDAALRMVSVPARGLWIEMICLMHQGSDYGYLKVNHAPILPHNLARMVGATLPEIEGWLQELESAGVFSRDDDGCICSRRMIRDEEVRAARAAGGKLGGNPELLKKKKVGKKVNLPANLEPTPSSSSSSSSSNSKDIALTAQAEFFLPTNRYATTGETFPVTIDDISLWSTSYEGVDVRAEIRKVIAWLDANPQKRKTTSGMKKFVNAWLGRAQNAPHSRNNPTPPGAGRDLRDF